MVLAGEPQRDVPAQGVADDVDAPVPSELRAGQRRMDVGGEAGVEEVVALAIAPPQVQAQAGEPRRLRRLGAAHHVVALGGAAEAVDEDDDLLAAGDLPTAARAASPSPAPGR